MGHPDPQNSCLILILWSLDRPVNSQSAVWHCAISSYGLHMTICLPSSINSSILLFFRLLARRTAITIRKDMAMMSRMTTIAMARLLILFDIQAILTKIIVMFPFGRFFI